MSASYIVDEGRLRFRLVLQQRRRNLEQAREVVLDQVPDGQRDPNVGALAIACRVLQRRLENRLRPAPRWALIPPGSPRRPASSRRASGASPLVQKRGNTGPPRGSSPPSRCTSSRIQSSSAFAPFRSPRLDAVQHLQRDRVRVFAGVEQFVLPVFLHDEDRQGIAAQILRLFRDSRSRHLPSPLGSSMCSTMSSVTSSELPSRASSRIHLLAAFEDRPSARQRPWRSAP